MSKATEYKFVKQLDIDMDISCKGSLIMFKDAVELCNKLVFERGNLYYETIRDEFGNSIYMSDDWMLLSENARCLHLDNAVSINCLRNMILNAMWSHCRNTAENMLLF